VPKSARERSAGVLVDVNAANNIVVPYVTPAR